VAFAVNTTSNWLGSALKKRSTFARVSVTIILDALGFEASECGLARRVRRISLLNESSSDLLARVVPPWSRYVVPVVVNGLEIIELNRGYIPFSMGYSCLLRRSTRSLYATLSSSKVLHPARLLEAQRNPMLRIRVQEQE
jgi:hypothetical protein